jgi:hypothetical protein
MEFDVPKTPLFNGEGPKIVDEELVPAVEFGVNLMQQTIVPLTPVGVTGMLRSGIQTSVLGVGVDLVGKVFNPIAYGLPVETGSRPHFPPVAPLELWVRRKLDVAAGKAHQVAFLIARKISRHGTKGVFMFKRGFDAAKPRVEQRFQTALVRIRNRLAGGGGA